MKTIELEVAMLRALNYRANLIVPNVYWGIPGLYYETDLVRLTPSGWATEFELKVSKQDILRDKKKVFAHRSRLFKQLFFVVPIELKEYALIHIPERAGLYTVSTNKWGGYVVDRVRDAKINANAIKWDDDLRFKLARLGALRVLGLKENNINLQKNIEELRQISERS